MSESQIITMTFFRYRGAADKWWAFRQMGLAGPGLEQVEGLSFFKLLGSGGGNGFSIIPDFGAYGLLGVWQHEDDAGRFFSESDQYQLFENHSEEQWTIFMRCVKVHGEWDGGTPFRVTADYDPAMPLAVITRATIYTKHLWRFWRFTPPVSRSMEDWKGLLFSKGIGELPVVQQATFSLWENSRCMQDYAYKSRRHKDVIRRTRQIGWYKEELFARFMPVAANGTWEGEKLLENLPQAF